MRSGSLDEWLHPVNREEELDNEPKKSSPHQRLNISIDVAFALDYLHHQCSTPIVHCDLEASNVLLNNDMTGHSTLWEVRSQQREMCIAIRILLLEMYTGKRPSDDMFKDSLNHHNFVRLALPHRVADVTDPMLFRGGEEETSTQNLRKRSCSRSEKIRDCLISIMQIGVNCSAELPKREDEHQCCCSIEAPNRTDFEAPSKIQRFGDFHRRFRYSKLHRSSRSNRFRSSIKAPDLTSDPSITRISSLNRDPEEAHARRGGELPSSAPWTFDPELLLKCLKTLKNQGSVYAPSFDHGVGDPIEDDIFVNLQKCNGAGQILEKVKVAYDIPIVTDVHESIQCEAVGKVADIIQIPAFLCRQTDLLVAAAKTGKIINIKKGQFCAPSVMVNSSEKIRLAGNENVMVCERGTMFGYNDLIVDPRNLEWMREANCPIVADITHSLQQPAGRQSVAVTWYNGIVESTVHLQSCGADLADAVIESLPYVGAMAVSNLESLVPLGSVEELLAAYDSQRRELPPPVTLFYSLVPAQSLLGCPW
ncbi:unnamed protein product [Camellia sinensis]